MSSINDDDIESDVEQLNSIFIVAWDQLGLESVVPVTDIYSADLFETIKTGTSVASKTVMLQLNMMMLRARMNPQRHYEIYSIHATPGITADDIKEMFDTNPQYAADLMRERGTKLYSDRAYAGGVKIT